MMNDLFKNLSQLKELYMQRQKKRQVYYNASMLYDGAIVATFPIRKPLPKKIKEEHIKIDEDGVCDKGWYSDGKQYSDINAANRFRFQDIMVNRLNTRRAIRELIFPCLFKLEKDMDDMRNQLNRIEQLLTNKG
jgi:hypothetical protein